MEMMVTRGAVVKGANREGTRIDLNRADAGEIAGAGIPPTLVQRIVNGRPFLTWSELEEFLDCDQPTWNAIRQKFCLGLVPG